MTHNLSCVETNSDYLNHISVNCTLEFAPDNTLNAVRDAPRSSLKYMPIKGIYEGRKYTW